MFEDFRPLPELRMLDMMLAVRFIGAPYIWAENGMLMVDGSYLGMGADCSGSQIWRFRRTGIIRATDDYNSQGLWNLMGTTGALYKPKTGALAVCGKSLTKVTHVMYCLNEQLCIDAPGGDSDYDTPEEAIRDGIIFDVHRIDRRNDVVGLCDPYQWYANLGGP